MDATTKTANSVHRMKRAYTKKAVSTKEANVFAPVAIPAGRAMLDVESINPMYGPAVLEGDDAVPVGSVALPALVSSGKTDAQNYAMRVWAGQSIDLPLAERKARVIAALEGQNLPTDVEFPL